MDVRAAMMLPLEMYPVVGAAKDINVKGLEEALDHRYYIIVSIWLDTLVEEPI